MKKIDIENPLFCSIPEYICLMNVLGATQATQTTIALYNSIRELKTDEHGEFLLTAVRAYKNGLFVSKVYYNVSI